MKVLSIRQPGAALVVAGARSVESRTWRTHHRGVLAVHASLHQDPAAFATARRLGLEIPELRFGGIVGVVELVDIVRDSDDPWAVPGEWHWLLAEPRPTPFIDCVGRPGLWERGLPTGVLREVRH